jgi:hypothetical protein
MITVGAVKILHKEKTLQRVDSFKPLLNEQMGFNGKQ